MKNKEFYKDKKEDNMEIPKLKSGNVVVLRNGDKYLVLTDCETYSHEKEEFVLVRLNGFNLGSHYDENLLISKQISNQFDIMEIHKSTVDASTYGMETSEKTLIWKRQEEKSQKMWNGMTYAEAHKKMWTAIGDNINLTKKEWLEENNKSGKEEEVSGSCFACQYTIDTQKQGDTSCSKCPICEKAWGTGCLNDLYDEWQNAKGLKKAELAYKIANLEWVEK